MLNAIVSIALCALFPQTQPNLEVNSYIASQVMIKLSANDEHLSSNVINFCIADDLDSQITPM